MSTRQKKWRNYRKHFSPINDFILRFTTKRLYAIRNDFSSYYITGKGYEIGAQNSPLSCKKADHITYIDYLTQKASAREYNIPEEECVNVDIVADANSLPSIPSGSASFVIANHVLEHTPNPIGAMLEWLRILKVDGTLFLTLPNFKTNEFDFEKTPACISHLKDDYLKALNDQDITSEHIYEHIRKIDDISPENQELYKQRYKEIVESNLHTHYHVFDRDNAMDVFHVINSEIPIQILNSYSHEFSFELLFVIKKGSPHFLASIVRGAEKHMVRIFVVVRQLAIFLFSSIFSKHAKSRKNE